MIKDLGEANGLFMNKDIGAVINQIDVPKIRNELLSYLTQILGGDALVAEYLILNLTSRVYMRSGTLPLGNLPLNLSYCMDAVRFPPLVVFAICQRCLFLSF